jgi:hypothetical protein
MQIYISLIFLCFAYTIIFSDTFLFFMILQIGLPVEMLCFSWFMCFFIGHIPWRASLRVLDVVLYKDTSALFQVHIPFLQKLNTNRWLLYVIFLNSCFFYYCSVFTIDTTQLLLCVL